MTITMDTIAVRDEMLEQAARAALDYINEWKRNTGGNAYGEPMYCGFAWVTVYPKFDHKGNTRQGKDERKLFDTVMTKLGLRKDYTGRAYELWNPSKWHGQSMDAKEAGARAAALVLRKYGFEAYMGSRAD
jgi:hypothetical protein